MNPEKASRLLAGAAGVIGTILRVASFRMNQGPSAGAPLAEIIVALTQSSVRPQAVQRVGTPEFIIGGSTGPVRTGETDEWPS